MSSSSSMSGAFRRLALVGIGAVCIGAVPLSAAEAANRPTRPIDIEQPEVRPRVTQVEAAVLHATGALEGVARAAFERMQAIEDAAEAELAQAAAAGADYRQAQRLIAQANRSLRRAAAEALKELKSVRKVEMKAVENAGGGDGELDEVEAAYREFQGRIRAKSLQSMAQVLVVGEGLQFERR